MYTQRKIKWKQGLLVQLAECKVVNNKYISERNWYVVKGSSLFPVNNNNWSEINIDDFYYDIKKKEYVYKYARPLYNKIIVNFDFQNENEFEGMRKE